MRTIEVQNFGPITNAKIEIRKFNLFIGEQSVGKSTLAKLVTIFTDNITLWSIFQFKEKIWEKYLDSYDLTPYAKDDYHIIFKEQEDNYEISIKISKNNIRSELLIDGETVTEDADIFAHIISNKPFYHNENLEQINNVLQTETTLTQTFYNLLRNSLYIPTERIVGAQITKILPIVNLVAKEQLSKNLLRFINELNNAKEKYATSKLDMLNVIYRKAGDEEVIVLKNKKKLPLNNASSGIQSALPLLLVVQYGINERDYASFVVEEPECNLFPQKQTELLQFLIKQIFSQNRMLTITTHSPYLLSALNNYMYAGRIAKELAESKDELKKIIDEHLWLDSDDCAIYSLGETINGGEYCLNLVDSTTGMIDFNYLDGVSLIMSEEFGKLNKLFIQHQRAKRIM
ncbi:MAG: AAA family ATPase [Paludibacteraceae bacterium]|nr:AAA family ATPase [Paludibacteraceae bacterium]